MKIFKKYNWKGKKILIAEDEDMNYMLLEETLKKTNLELLRAEDGNQAINLFMANQDVNLILMDVKMPKINGYEATAEIRKKSNVPIIAQTAYAMSGEEKKSFTAGCNAYISKPIRIDELLELIDKYIN